MRNDETQTVCLLVESDGVKGDTVLQRLLEDNDFIKKFELIILLDDSRGRCHDTVREYSLPYTVADQPNDPDDEIRDIARNAGGIQYLITCGWGYIIPEETLEVPEICLNCHSSYLPEYKGLSVYRAQWANAECEGGVTVHRLTPEIDEGNIITRQRYRIGLFETPVGMARTYSALSAALLRESIYRLESGYEGLPQTDAGSYYTQLPWTVTLSHGIINHLFRAVGSSFRWTVPPTDK